MPTTTDVKFNCASCRREYRWKPELAGKQAKCKCGAVMTVPRTPPPPPIPSAQQQQDDFGLDGLYALAAEEKSAAARIANDPTQQDQGYRCPSCGTSLQVGTTLCPNCNLNLSTGKRRVAQADAAQGIAAASRGFVTKKRGGGTGAALAIKGGKQGAVAAPEGFTDANPVRDLYVPLGMIGVGLVLYFFQIRLAYSTEDAETFGRMYLMANVISDVILLGVAMLICLKFITTRDALPQTMLKFAAVAVGPTALGVMAEHFVSDFHRRAGWLAGAVVAIGLYWAALKYLFNLNQDNTAKVAFTIYIVRVWGKVLMFLVLVVVVIGMIFKKAGEGGEMGEGGDDTEDVRTSPQDEAKANDAEAERMLKEEDFFEAREWLKADPKHTIYNLNERSAPTVESVYAMGATKVSVGVSGDGAGGPIKAQLIVELPADPDQRAKIIEWATSAEKEFGGEDAETFKDIGQKYLAVSFHWD